ncbi:LPXTG cell wall anchor domain-containing protein [Lactococcus hircilactis]
MSDSDSVSDSESGHHQGYPSHHTGTLPKTGDQDNSLSSVGGMLAGLAMLGALGVKKKKKN